jgi:hypothetical protein
MPSCLETSTPLSARARAASGVPLAVGSEAPTAARGARIKETTEDSSAEE